MTGVKKVFNAGIVLIVLLFSSVQLLAMEQSGILSKPIVSAFGSNSIKSPVQVYFNPQDQSQIVTTLFNLLDNAKKQICIAIYWLTDKVMLEKIIAAKRRGVEVNIIIDASSLTYLDITPQLLEQGIVPVVYPSDYVDAAGIMHHKFVVIDGAIVFTGSANFTQVVLNPKIERFNFENVVIINIPNVVKKFIAAFDQMKKEIFDFYVDIVAQNDSYDSDDSSSSSDLPSWMSTLLPMIYKEQDLMRQSVKQLVQRYPLEVQKRINSFFEKQPTEKQKDTTIGLQKKETKSVGGLQLSERREDPITDPQKKLLNMNFFANKEIMGLSKKEASELITKIKSEDNWERATEKQRALLRNKGVSDLEVLKLSKQDASDLIDDIMSKKKKY